MDITGAFVGTAAEQVSIKVVLLQGLSWSCTNTPDATFSLLQHRPQNSRCFCTGIANNTTHKAPTHLQPPPPSAQRVWFWCLQKQLRWPCQLFRSHCSPGCPSGWTGWSLSQTLWCSSFWFCHWAWWQIKLIYSHTFIKKERQLYIEVKCIWWLTLCIPAVVPGPSLPQLCPSGLCAPLCQHSPGRYRPPLDLLPKWQESCLQGKKRNKPRMWETLSFAVSKQHTQIGLLDVENNINSLHFSLWSSKVVLLAGNLAMIQANQGSRFIGFPQITKILGHK